MIQRWAVIKMAPSSPSEHLCTLHAALGSHAEVWGGYKGPTLGAPILRILLYALTPHDAKSAVQCLCLLSQIGVILGQECSECQAVLHI